MTMIVLPTALEINLARRQVEVGMSTMFESIVKGAMSRWDGECWHKDEVLLGVLIGLQIAENRKND